MKILLALSILFTSCSSLAPVAEKRDEIIDRTIKAIQTNDTLSLFRLIDTSRYFSLYGKEALLFKVELVRSALKPCSVWNWKTQVAKTSDNTRHTKYSIQFCASADQSTKIHGFELTFADYKFDYRIASFDVLRGPIGPKETVSPPRSN